MKNREKYIEGDEDASLGAPEKEQVDSQKAEMLEQIQAFHFNIEGFKRFLADIDDPELKEAAKKAMANELEEAFKKVEGLG